jgi:hypothetical protein
MIVQHGEVLDGSGDVDTKISSYSALSPLMSSLLASRLDSLQGAFPENPN